MFGLESHKKKKPEEFVFELEKELKNPVMYKATLTKVEDRMQSIKESLRSGEDQEEFNRFGLILQGYIALIKVISRVVSKPKTK